MRPPELREVLTRRSAPEATPDGDTTARPGPSSAWNSVGSTVPYDGAPGNLGGSPGLHGDVSSRAARLKPP